MALIGKIVSGGQTGADLAALEFALRHNIPHGGWCPRRRKCETGTIPRRFELVETPSTGYSQRTLWNVRDSDGTVIFSIGPRLKRGSKKTAAFARELGKPWRHISAEALTGHESALKSFVRENRICILNVAGPRKSEEPRIGRFVARVLTALLHGKPGRACRL